MSPALRELHDELAAVFRITGAADKLPVLHAREHLREGTGRDLKALAQIALGQLAPMVIELAEDLRLPRDSPVVKIERVP